MKFTAKNFQIHSDLELDLKPFTVITGPSGSGKSAFIRALKTLLYNIPAGGFVKHGQKEMTITLDNVEYCRNPSVSYTIDGTTYNAIGRNALPQLEQMGYSSIEIDKKKYYPQIAQQFDSPFLISFSDAEVSKLLSQLSQSGRLKVAKEGIKKSQIAISDTLKIRLTDRESLQAKLSGVKVVLESLPRFEAIAASRIALESTKQTLDRLRHLLIQINDNKRYLNNVPKKPTNPDSYIKVAKLVNTVHYKVPKIPAISHLSSQYSTLMQIIGLNTKIRSFGQEKGVPVKIAGKNFGGILSSLENKIATEK